MREAVRVSCFSAYSRVFWGCPLCLDRTVRYSDRACWKRRIPIHPGAYSHAFQQLSHLLRAMQVKHRGDAM
ncbi:hypothetical protein CYLTODRAFT_425665 [Cylindrobasidium torrendii FP15055 ss-10]|uniref:Uncharacterized protein n=1 Tax=Cylindrobasidium torrendii FP15055 ss-10 TaxID=1314674 RepID=A0A0D7B1B9_9AGAR|nr:hypothetical protein CYLTODRAFT_425665 [Cylindrobasidium torrendii FP15055 ss-10]